MYKKYPFNLSYKIIPSVLSYESVESIDFNNIGIYIKNLKTNLIISVSCVSKYNENYNVIKKDITCLKGNNYNIDCSNIYEGFMYNTKYLCYPNEIEFIIFISECAPLKWNINISNK